MSDKEKLNKIYELNLMLWQDIKDERIDRQQNLNKLADIGLLCNPDDIFT